ncbi:MAG TPA: adenylate/guanylate cyclase domain-containing protein [Pyrinomonadaceae bacterium]|nr:adenylate/guanylate cyclase domain-containing protein [Pyrinomonadaceae bacterium]
MNYTVSAILNITDPSGHVWEFGLESGHTYTIGRAKDNDIVLNDRRVSRKHAHIAAQGDEFKLIDGYIENGQLIRSVNRIFVNGLPQFEHILETDDKVTIGETELQFRKITPFNKQSIDQYIADQPTNLASHHIDLSEFGIDSMPSTENAINLSSQPAPRIETKATPPPVPEPETEISHPPVKIPAAPLPAEGAPVKYDDTPLGHTQLQISANEIIGHGTKVSMESPVATPDEIRILRRKAKMLELVYEMSKTLGTVFELKAIFEKATDLIFRGTPADRVVALLRDDIANGNSNQNLRQIALRTRDESIGKFSEKLTVSRTVTQKVMRDRVALLSQDARTDAQLQGAESIVSQGVRSTICAPLITESGVHGVIYADRLDPFAAFTEDHLELITAVAAQAAVIVETVRAHERLAREEVARANYGRFMPEYVVKQLLENPDSFRLGGINQTITVLFADIRGFTSLSERENPERVVRLLNRYFTAMTEIIFEHGGTLDKYIGDGLMALFGAPTATPNDAINAAKAAVVMQRKINSLNGELVAEGLSPVTVGIGLHTGEAVIGYIGSEKRSEYTAIGDTVNLAARLEANARGGQILLSEATARAIGNAFPLVAHEPLTVRNRVQPVSLFELNIG